VTTAPYPVTGDQKTRFCLKYNYILHEGYDNNADYVKKYRKSIYTL
jgi:hypothetical protein